MMRIAPISVFDISAQQAWLEDMAARGWFLKDYSSDIFSLTSFSKGEPKAVRYRLGPVTPGEASPGVERREVYRGFGWEYVTTIGKELYVWRSDDPAAPCGRRTRMWRIYWAVGVLLALLCIVDTFGDSNQCLHLPEDPLPVVSTADLGCLEEDGSGGLHREPLTGDRLYVWQGRTADGRGTACHWAVYDLRLPFLVPQLLRDLARTEVKGETDLSLEKVADSRFEELRWLQVADGTQYLLARRDGRVIYLRTGVPELLADHLAELDRAMDLPIPVR